MERAFFVALLSILLVAGAGAKTLDEPHCGPGASHERHNLVAVADHPGMILFDSSGEERERLGYLLIDNAGVPYVFPSPHSRSPLVDNSELCCFSKERILSFWPTAKNDKALNEISLDCYGWNTYPAPVWRSYRVSLKFEKDQCLQYKVIGSGILNSDWLSSSPLPRAVRSSTGHDLRPNMFITPQMFCNLDGPRNTHSCGWAPEIVNERPYTSGRLERHLKTSPVLSGSSPLPDNE